MARMTLDVNVRDIEALVLQLPERQFLRLASSIEDRLETLSLMKAAEPAFREWNRKGEDIYDGQPPAR